MCNRSYLRHRPCNSRNICCRSGIAGTHVERSIERFAGNSQTQLKARTVFIGDAIICGCVDEQRALVVALGFDAEAQLAGARAAQHNHGQVEIGATFETQAGDGRT